MTGVERRIGAKTPAKDHLPDFILNLAEEEIGGTTELERSDVAVRRPSDQSMVVIPFDQHPDHQTTVSGDVSKNVVQLRLIEHSLVASSPLIRARMGMEDTTVSMLEQLGTLDDQPLFVRVSYHLAHDFTPVSQLWRDKRLHRQPIGTADAFRMTFGAPLGETQSSVEAVRSDNRTAASLRVSVGSPMMLREMVLSDGGGVVRELSFTHFRADRVALEDGSP